MPSDNPPAADTRPEHNIYRTHQQAQTLHAVRHLARDLIHELKNCLGGISGAAELIEIDVDDDPSVNDLIAVIFSSTDNALTAINTLATFISESDPTINDAKHRRLDLHVFLDQQYRYYAACMGKHIPVALRHDADQTCISCDPHALAHITMNLVLNAKESINERGQLVIQTGNLHVPNTRVDNQAQLPDIPAGDYVDLCFSDTGCGIDEQHLAHLVQLPNCTQVNPNQVTVTETTEFKANGMGLYLAADYMRQQNGYLRIASGSGLGTKVHLFFPLAAP